MPAHDPKIEKFYRSKLWKTVRNYVVSKSRGICQKCGKAGWEVHHKIPLTVLNVDNPDIALNPENLELLCTSCHDAERSRDTYIRGDLIFTKEGEIVQKAEHPPVENQYKKL